MSRMSDAVVAIRRRGPLPDTRPMASHSHTSPPPGHDDPELLDADEVAALLHCSSRHVLRLAADGRAPAPVRVGTLVRWPRSVIRAWIEAGCQPPPPATSGQPDVAAG
jgi:excisionase family DNA binding protein